MVVLGTTIHEFVNHTSDLARRNSWMPMVDLGPSLGMTG